jgi:ketosteroid isomerase-like protein
MSNVEFAHKLYDALEAGDTKLFRSYFADNATVWHNFDNQDQSIDEAVSQLEGMMQAFTGTQYKDRRYMNVDSGAIAQQVSYSGLHNGNTLITPMMQHIYISDGLVQRIEEYFDTTQAAAIMGG